MTNEIISKNCILNKKDNKSLFLVFLVVMVSGNPAIKLPFGDEPVLIITCIYLAWLLIKKNRLLIENKGINQFLIFIIIFLFQVIYFDFIPVRTFIGFFIRLYIAYAIIRVVDNFTTLYIRILYKICILSLVIWSIGRTGLIDGIILSLPEWKYYKWTGITAYALGIHTFYMSPETGVLRNAGLFWEPGAFAGYIIVSIIFLSLSRQSISSKVYRRYLIVFILALLSTMSTAGYVLLPLAVVLGYDFKRKKGSHKYKNIVIFSLIIFSFSLGSLIALKNLDFLSEKINHQLEKTLTNSEQDIAFNNTRFGSLIFDWYYIKTSPIFGNGPHEITRYRFHQTDRLDGQGNGLSSFVAKYGLLGFVCFVYHLYIGFSRSFGKSKKIFLAIFIILASLNAEPFLNYPLFLSFMFLNNNKKLNLTTQR